MAAAARQRENRATSTLETSFALGCTYVFARDVLARRLHLYPDAPYREHIHSVTRTPNGNDYGKDLLRQHYASHPH